MTDLFTCQAYVQKGENDICDDGKEIAEAEDWESTVKENRSSLHPCLIHLISLHIFSTVISSPSVNNTLDCYQRAYVQNGENDICDDGKEIAEAEDWESTVKENRSPLPPCLIHPISLHNFSTVISSPSVNNTLDCYQKSLRNRIGIALQDVHPDYHRRQLKF
ncbi:hypothetical protein EMCRGX_G004962 [Ephydatia muelleri]